MKKLNKLALIPAILIPAVAVAQINVGETIGTSEEAVREALVAQGYEITEIEIEDKAWEIEALLDGVEYEIEVSMETGTIMEIELEDDEDDEDEDYDDDEKEELVEDDESEKQDVAEKG